MSHSGIISNNIDILIKHADEAMYTAKEKGKNQFVFYNRAIESL